MTKCLAFRILGNVKGLNNWFLQWNKKFTVRWIFFATWKSAGFFLQFLVQKWTKKESKLNFFELWGFVLMSQMILEEKETFFSKNVARNRIFPFWGSDPFIAPQVPLGARGIFSWLILAFYYRTSMISRKKGGVKILPAKMSVWLSHRVKRKIVPWFICPVGSSTFVKYPLCQVSKISNDHFCILSL